MPTTLKKSDEPAQHWVIQLTGGVQPAIQEEYDEALALPELNPFSKSDEG